jgi:hypothetical protein
MKILAAIAISLLCSSAAFAGALPMQEGACVWTKISKLEHRLQNGEHGPMIPDSGSAVAFANGGYQVSYDEVDAVHHAHTGDRALMCLISIPHPCPPGDARGRWYTTTDLRTMESWTMMDSEHSCGGA